MTKIKSKVIYKNSIYKKYFSSVLQRKFKKRYSKILNNILKNLDTPNNTLHSLSDKYKFNFKEKHLIKFRKFKTIIIIGMGGSILGSESIYFALKKKIKKDFIFINNLDEDMVNKIRKKKNLDRILFIVISKSGNTVETLSNFLALKLLKPKSKNLIIISNRNNRTLSNLAKRKNINFIEHKKFIGGRYSVLSEVGMVPAYLMGLNIIKFRKNLLNQTQYKKDKFLKSSSIALSNLLMSKKIVNLVLLSYEAKFDPFLYWVQQLIAESLGKNGRGFFPIISTAPKDHHSLLQLYLDGPRDKIFYIFSEKRIDGNKLKGTAIDKELKFLNNKSLRKIKKAQKEALIKVFKKNKIPFREFEIKNLNEETLGELFAYFMVETAIIGKMTNINPFNQPAVEEIKTITKNILS